MTAPTSRIQANALAHVKPTDPLPHFINADTLGQGMITLGDLSPSAFQGHPLVLHAGVQSADVAADGRVTIISTQYHLAAQKLDIIAKVVLSRDGPHGSFGFDIFDPSGRTLLYSMPITQAFWGSVSI